MSSAGDGGRYISPIIVQSLRSSFANSASSWRRAGGNQQQQQNPRQQQQQQSSSRDRSNQNQSNRQSASGPPGNVWANRDKSSGTATPTSAGGQAKGGQQSGGTTTPAGLAEDRHVPLKDFNAGETKQFLKKSAYMPFSTRIVGSIMRRGQLIQILQVIKMLLAQRAVCSAGMVPRLLC